ncbi:MAG: FKBP-type peptidyl-prolyl cis-trans isomerase [Prevotella sp.]|nr:FKBP-type peptidyl-prolyl cis-trans isomerase [Prevotella sp.]
MDKTNHKFVQVTYKLYATKDGVTELTEQSAEGRPLTFYSGMGMVLDDFESEVLKHAQGEDFDFTLSPSQAYGDYNEQHVIDIDKDVFSPNGTFDAEHIYKDAIVPLQNEQGNRFLGHVLDITDTHVKVDLNHPLAGKTLNFKGTVVANRDASDDEVQKFIDQANAHQCGHCSGGCDGCGGGEDGCGGHDGGCCGNCNA